MWTSKFYILKLYSFLYKLFFHMPSRSCSWLYYFFVNSVNSSFFALCFWIGCRIGFTSLLIQLISFSELVIAFHMTGGRSRQTIRSSVEKCVFPLCMFPLRLFYRLAPAPQVQPCLEGECHLSPDSVWQGQFAFKTLLLAFVIKKDLWFLTY